MHGVREIKVGIDSLSSQQTKPSIFSLSQNTHNTLEMIKYANEHIKVTLNTVITENNHKHVDEILNFAIQAGIPRVKILRLNELNPINSTNSQNQKEGSYFDTFYDSCLKKSTKSENIPGKARVDMWIPTANGKQLEICFLRDVCDGACGNMYTQINADGTLMICPRDSYATPVDFSKSYNEVAKIVSDVTYLRCDAEAQRFAYKENPLAKRYSGLQGNYGKDI